MVEKVLIDICRRGLREYLPQTPGRAEGSTEFISILRRIRGNKDSLKSSSIPENAHTVRIKNAIEVL